MLIRLCIVQFDRSEKRPEVNRDKMTGLLKGIPAGTGVILLPEGWLGPLVIDHDDHTALLHDLQNCLPPGDPLLVTGGQYVRCPEGRVISTGALVNRREILFYDKHFPSGAIGERNFVVPGSRLPVASHRGIKAAAVLCVDLFYPEITRNLAMRGALLVLNPANIPAGRMDLWQHIGVTRAAENTVFLAMANNTLTRYPDGREVTGRSFVAGPDGIFFYDCGSEPGTYLVELDLGLVDRVRQRWKYLEDVRKSHLAPSKPGNNN